MYYYVQRLEENKCHSFLQENQEGEAPENCNLVTLTSILMEQLSLETITRDFKDRKIISSDHDFTNGKSCLTNLINICDQVTSLVDERKALDIFCLYFSKAFDTCLS